MILMIFDAQLGSKHGSPRYARYGFQASEQGIEEMEMELEFLEEDGDVYVARCIMTSV